MKKLSQMFQCFLQKGVLFLHYVAIFVIRNLQYLPEKTLKHQNKALSVEMKYIIQNSLLVPLYF